MPSLMRAWRYGKRLACASEIGVEIGTGGEASSARRVARTWGEVLMWRSIERMAKAVLSAPTNLRRS